MVISDTRLAGVKEIILTPLEDLRGSFTKIYHQGLYHDAGVDFSLKEQYISVSRKNVIRGMHFQTPPHACDKNGKRMRCTSWGNSGRPPKPWGCTWKTARSWMGAALTGGS